MKFGVIKSLIVRRRSIEGNNMNKTMNKRKLAKTLKPQPKSRYLPGEVNLVTERGDLKRFIEHRVNVVYAEPKIDNKPPKFNPLAYLKPLNLDMDAARVRTLDRDNKELLKKINIINRMGGKVECWNLKAKYKSNFGEKEWENRRIMRRNKEILKGILGTMAAYPMEAFMRDWKRIELNLEHMSRYPLIWKRKPTIVKELLSADGSRPRRPHCFFDLEIADDKLKLGRIVFELYDDFAPQTCANFQALCVGEEGLSYKNTPFHRIVPGHWCQGGDVTKYNGTGGASIYGDTFKDENFSLHHTGPGVLSMWSNGENTNNSKFNLTFERLESMDGKRVVFGQIVRGISNLFKIQVLGAKSGKPIKKVTVSKCGVLRSGPPPPMAKSELVEEEEED